MTRYLLFCLTIIFPLAACGSLPVPTAQPRDVLYQVSTLGALQQGLFNGAESISVLKQHGDFGLGTFDGLNGEMIVLDGKVYQVTVDGVRHVASDNDTTPFAVVTYFDPDINFTLDHAVDLAGLGAAIDTHLPTPNVIYAIKIAWTFDYIKTRSEARQSPPFPLLADALKNQTTFEFNNVSGTLVGFRMPAYAGGMNQVGYHFHFITDTGAAGGHVLDLKINSVPILLDETRQWETALPDDPSFDGAILNPPK